MPFIVSNIKMMVNVCRDHTVLYFGIICFFHGTQKMNFVSPITSFCLMLTISIFVSLCHHGMTLEMAYLHSEGECSCISVSIPCTSKAKSTIIEACKKFGVNCINYIKWSKSVGTIKSQSTTKNRGKKSSGHKFHFPILGPITDVLMKIMIKIIKINIIMFKNQNKNQ